MEKIFVVRTNRSTGEQYLLSRNGEAAPLGGRECGPEHVGQRYYSGEIE